MRLSDRDSLQLWKRGLGRSPELGAELVPP
jgi:hypothetical protein